MDYCHRFKLIHALYFQCSTTFWNLPPSFSLQHTHTHTHTHTLQSHHPASSWNWGAFSRKKKRKKSLRSPTPSLIYTHTHTHTHTSIFLSFHTCCHGKGHLGQNSHNLQPKHTHTHTHTHTLCLCSYHSIQELDAASQFGSRLTELSEE